MKQRPVLVWLLACSLPLFWLSSCREDTILRASLSPGNDTLYTQLIDTSTILSGSFEDDTIVTSLNIAGLPIVHALGTVSTDPYSGKTTSASVFQIVPPTTAFTFPATPDSAVLVIPYAGFSWGDTSLTIQQTYTAYELTDTLARDTLYYSKTVKNFGAALGSATVTYGSVKDSVTVNGVKKAPHLRIKLSNDFVSRMNAAATNGNPIFSSYASFLGWFRGFYVKMTGGDERVLHYFQLDGSNDYGRAGVLFYYTDTAGVKTTPFYFNTSYVAHFNSVRRDYSGTSAAAFFNTQAVSDSVILIQNEPGGVADLKFPFIKNLPKAPVNKAELVITQAKTLPFDQPTVYNPPERLFPIGIDANGKSYTVLDRFPTSSTEPLSFINGRRNDVTINGVTYSQYIINIPREVQRAIREGRDTLHLRVSGASGFTGAYRLIAAGAAHSNPELRVKLKVYFSKL